MRTLHAIRMGAGLTLPLLATSSGLAASAGDGTVAQRLRVIGEVAQAGPFMPDWASLENYTVPEWHRDAKFGIFIHRGVSSVPAFSDWRHDSASGLVVNMPADASSKIVPVLKIDR